MSALSQEDWKRVEPLVDALLDLSPTDHVRYLYEACAGDPELRAQVEGLLAASNDASLLEAPAAQFALPIVARKQAMTASR